MKKTNNRYRNNNSSNTIYSFNYKFDSTSIAGKISGTALDLIKRYNDMAKDALSSNDHVSAEIFRQYAEHYRKIVTEINERKNNREQSEANDNQTAATVEQPENTQPQPAPVAPVAEEKAPIANEPDTQPTKKSFHVIEINQPSEATEDKIETKPRRTYRRKTAAEA